MKKLISLLLSVCLLALPAVSLGAEEDGAEIRVAAVCGSESVEVGDQFMVKIMIDGEFDGYLVYSVAGSFDPAVAELVAPVYKDDGFSVVYNEFSNEDGTFQFDAADFSLNGSRDNLIMSLLFEAKAPGKFELHLGHDDGSTVFVGRIGVNGSYSAEQTDLDLTVTDDSDGRQNFIIKEREPLTPYADMGGYDWAEIAVGAMARIGVLDGIADGESFEPAKSITRGEFVAMLIRGAKITGTGEQFPDVPEDYPFAAEIAAARKKGIALGDGKGNFNPDATVTRQDITAFVYRTLHLMGKMDEAPLEVLDDFSDSADISDYAVQTMASVVRAGIIRGDDMGLLNPKKDMTRAEAAVLIERVIIHIRLVL